MVPSPTPQTLGSWVGPGLVSVFPSDSGSHFSYSCRHWSSSVHSPQNTSQSHSWSSVCALTLLLPFTLLSLSLSLKLSLSPLPHRDHSSCALQDHSPNSTLLRPPFVLLPMHLSLSISGEIRLFIRSFLLVSGSVFPQCSLS